MIRRAWCALFHGHDWRVTDLRVFAASFPGLPLLWSRKDYYEKYGFTIIRSKCQRCGGELKQKFIGDWSLTPQYTEELSELRKMAGL